MSSLVPGHLRSIPNLPTSSPPPRNSPSIVIWGCPGTLAIICLRPQGSGCWLIPNQLHGELPTPRFVVELHEHDLLPSPQQKSAVQDRDSQRRTDERCPQMP